MKTCFVDFETRSEAPLRVCGAYAYAHHPSTEVLLTAWAIDDGEVQVIDGFPADLFKADYTFVAWNAQFDEQILRAQGVGVEVVDAAAHARQFGVPAALGKAARFLSNENLKSPGKTLIDKFCSPPYDDPAGPDWEAFADYCVQDVEVMREIWNVLPAPTERQLEDYRVNEDINARGILIDNKYVTAALRYSNEEQRECALRVQALTGLPKSRGVNLTRWVWERLPEELTHLMKTEAGSLTFNRNTRTNLLEGDLPAEVREVVELASATSAASTSKLQTMVNRAGDDDRVRGSFRYYGANTGRFSAHGLQLQNFPRPVSLGVSVSEINDMVLAGWEPENIVKATGMSLLDTLKHTLRGCLVSAPGHSFVCSDWSQIEGRVNPWLADSDSGREKLAVYQTGTDIYIRTAATILQKHPTDVTGTERLIYGKVPELSLGFGGGVGALQRIAATYNVASAIDLPLARRIVSDWRAANVWATEFWRGISAAVGTAYRQPLHDVTVGLLTYTFVPNFLGGAMLCYLPSGRPIVYPFFRMGDSGDFVYAKAAHGPKATDRNWPESPIWHGLLCENAVQGAASDILRDTLSGLGDYPVVAHSHDEVLLEVPTDEAEAAQRNLEDMMSAPYGSLPLACESWVGERYRK